MKNDLTELVFILDMSGSMGRLTSDTIGGYNSLIKEQKKQKGDAIVTTILFDDRYIVLHDRVPLKKVKPLTTDDYKPLGMTAMLDAVGRTINSIGQKLAETPEEERPATVMVTIITDGLENASKEYTWEAVQGMIKHQREKYSWIFTFIGANIDIEKVSSDLGIDARLAKKYTASKKGTDSVYKAMADTASLVRGKRMTEGATMSAVSFDAMLNEASEKMDEIE